MCVSPVIGKRKGSHSPYYSIPGGHLDAGETFENCAIREIQEESGLTIKDPRVIAVTNNLDDTFFQEGKHYISIVLLATDFSGEHTVMEPVKCEGWLWCDPAHLPTPHFGASQSAVDRYLRGVFYFQ
ncbi:NUDIX domain-containing protein [Candidatus Kaiserbacteria bacterium]|nr:NUDIX domain-containing protein [Candidatus Kaiserbacteria bacterium]